MTLKGLKFKRANNWKIKNNRKIRGSINKTKLKKIKELMAGNTDPKKHKIKALLKDNYSGFTISGTDFVFKFDKHGGWYDEYRNYYDLQPLFQFNQRFNPIFEYP